MKKPDEWMPLHVRKYLGDTMHLTRDQHGAYMLLLMAYWMRGGSLPANDDELAAIVRAGRADWRKLRPVLEPFFVVSDGKWTQKRAEAELAKARKFTSAKVEAGRKGAASRWNGETIGTAMAKPLAETSLSLSRNDAPIPLPITKGRKKDMSADADVAFDEFYKAFGAPKNSKKPDARKAWRQIEARRPSQPDLLRAVAGYNAWLAGEWQKNKREFPAKQHAATWLRGEVWTEFLDSAQPLTPEEIERNKDRADRLMRRGKYAQGQAA